MMIAIFGGFLLVASAMAAPQKTQQNYQFTGKGFPQAPGQIFSTTVKPCDIIPTECPAVDPFDKTIHLAHEYDCSKFYMCHNGSKVLRECAGNGAAYFNVSLGVCDFAEKVYCPTAGFILTPDEQDCAAYYATVNGQSYDERCPTNLYFSKSAKRCVVAKEANCPYPIIAADNYDCTKYIEIVNNVETSRSCPAGYRFSRNAQVCKPEAETPCHQSPKPCDPKVVFVPATTTTTTTTTTTPKPVPVGPCAGREDGTMIPDAVSCTKYTVCSRGMAYPQECADGLFVSSKTGTCVPRSYSDCPETNVYTIPKGSKGSYTKL